VSPPETTVETRLLANALFKTRPFGFPKDG